MAAKQFKDERLLKLLSPLGFTLNEPASLQYGIEFIRPSPIERLFEHLLIGAANPVHAETVVSAATQPVCHPCVSERDTRLRTLLANGSEVKNCSLLFGAVQTKAWLKRLVENADHCCRLTSTEKGPALVERLTLVVEAVDSYMKLLGDIFAIFDMEFAFVTTTTPDEHAEMERLATIATRFLYLDSEDAKIASLAIVRFGSIVERESEPFKSKRPSPANELGARFVLLVERIQSKRREYQAAGGLTR